MWLVFLGFLLVGAPLIIANDIITDDIPVKVNNEKHHKVHNLILNPEQHSWCEPKQIRQIVTHTLCESQEIKNYVCVGTCFSYSVPQTEPETPGDEMLDYCDSCQAAESHWTTVNLACEDDGLKYEVTKNVQRITNCTCATCRPMKRAPLSNDVTRSNDYPISELIYNMLPNKPESIGASKQFKVDNSINEIDVDDTKLSKIQMSLGDLKKEFKLNASQEARLSGKLLMKDLASFIANEDEEEAKV